MFQKHNHYHHAKVALLLANNLDVDDDCDSNPPTDPLRVNVQIWSTFDVQFQVEEKVYRHQIAQCYLHHSYKSYLLPPPLLFQSMLKNDGLNKILHVSDD
jgi:hypothetical protein